MSCCAVQAAVERAQKNMEALGDIATDHRAVQVMGVEVALALATRDLPGG